MYSADRNLLTDFWVIGINYRKSDAALRGRYAVSNEQYERILATSPAFGISEFFVLSTCNRTEIYGFSKDPRLLSALLCSFTEGDEAGFLQQAYCKNGNDALTHIFNVSAGLDSQILGDYEIVGQMKAAVNMAREHGRIGQFMDRLFNTALQSSRAIRSETQLSSGTVSVAFAAVQFLKSSITDFSDKKVLIIGSGKIGQSTCKNLASTIAAGNIILMNRTDDKAAKLAGTLGVQMMPYKQLQEGIDGAAIIIVATNAAQPLITRSHIKPGSRKILIDLSIPNNIDPLVQDDPHITLVNVDDLSRINDETLRKRQAEVPKAKALINYHIHEFAEWYMMRRNVPVLKAVKEKLTELNLQLFEARQCSSDKMAVQRVINNMAAKMRSEERRPGCNYIEAINSFISEASSA